MSFVVYAQLYFQGPLLPLWIVAQGGNAAIVGFAGTAFSLSSIVLRPYIGRIADAWSTRGVLVVGSVLLAASGAAYALPGLLALFFVRVVHGLGWGAINTAGSAVVAAVAPPARRGEAGGYYAAVPGLAQAAFPALGLLALPIVGFAGVFIISGAIALLAIVAVWFVRLPAEDRGAAEARQQGRLIDRSAFRPTVLETLFGAPFALFAAFTPLYATELGIPVESLGVFYTALGMTILVSRMTLGRVADRVGRGRAIVLGGCLAMAGIVGLWLARDVLGLTLAAVSYGVATGLVTPATFALVIDRAHPARRSAAMATYSMAFQFAAGVGSAVWGVLITIGGFPAAFLGALLCEAALVVAALDLRRGTAKPARVTAGGPE